MAPAPASIPLRLQTVDVGVLLELTTEVMERQARAHGARLVIRVDEDVPTSVTIDREKVGWAITSLVGSALRHAQGPGGIIQLKVSQATRSKLMFCVRDNGPGIPSGDLAGMLRRDAWRPGSALALLLVEDIAVAHGGRLWIESNAVPHDHFTSVCFTIALQDAAGRD